MRKKEVLETVSMFIRKNESTLEKCDYNINRSVESFKKFSINTASIDEFRYLLVYRNHLIDANKDLTALYSFLEKL